MTNDNSSTSLRQRTALPADVRVMLEQYPRATWTANPGIEGTGEMWLAFHEQFRRGTADLAALVDHVREAKLAPPVFMARYSRLSQALLSGLEGHHGIEDSYYFPAFIKAEKRLRRGFEIMDADHHVIHNAIDGFATVGRAAAAAIGARDEKLSPDAMRAIDGLANSTQEFRRILVQHLADEEDLVIPLLLESANRGRDAA